MPDLSDLELMVRSQTPIIVIESHEERRALDLFRKLGRNLRVPISRWTITGGLQRMEQGYRAQSFNAAPIDVLRHLKTSDLPGVYILLDFHPYLEDPVHTRLIREIAQEYRAIPKLLVFLSPSFVIPKDFSQLCARFELSMPSKQKVMEIIKSVAVQWTRENPGRKVVADRKAVQLLARNLAGLTSSDVERLARKAIYDDGAITSDDLDMVMRAKYELISQDGVLSFEYETAAFGDVGGLKNLKHWLELRKAVFHGKGQQYGLETPKGVMLLGVQGCGKSLAAKAVAGVWQVPLLRLDFGTLYNKYIGETERNLREALKTAGIMAPCVLWIDEIEKGLGGGGGDDGGVSRRILGTLLTWMAEKEEGVFIVATANDVSSLPPELLRKGRFDELFFVDLPDPESRAMIFEIQLRRRKLDPRKFDLTTLAQHSNGFSGAEIEQAVVSALYVGLSQGGIDTEKIVCELQKTRPLSVLMAEKVQSLRQWASQRTVPAN